MLNNARLMAFVSATQRAKALEFYQTILGLTLLEDENMALIFDAGGTMLRVSIVEELVPQPFTVLGWEVPDIASKISDLQNRGVVFERFSFFSEDASGAYLFPDGTRVAWFKDWDGNLLSLSQLPEK